MMLSTKIIAALFLMLVSAASSAGRADYSHLSDAEMHTVVLSVTGMLIGFAALGIFGWLRYRQRYTPAPGRFTPNQALFATLMVIALALGVAAYALLPL